jgi:hypothetical protein
MKIPALGAQILHLSNVRQVGAFETTDGLVWKTAEQAKVHQLFCNLKIVRNELGLDISDYALQLLASRRHKLQAALDASLVA